MWRILNKCPRGKLNTYGNNQKKNSGSDERESEKNHALVEYLLERNFQWKYIT